MIPVLVFSSASTSFTTTLSAKGLIVIFEFLFRGIAAMGESRIEHHFSIGMLKHILFDRFEIYHGQKSLFAPGGGEEVSNILF